MLRTDELDYELPPGLIATHPAEPRDAARLMVVRRSSAELEHAQVRDLPRFLRRSDVLVLNTTAVAPARLAARLQGKDRLVDGLFLNEVEPLRWRIMLNGHGRLKPGDQLELVDQREAASGVVLRLLERIEGDWLTSVESPEPTERLLERVGRTPLPPYIVKARGSVDTVTDEQDRRWYQTVYADLTKRQSIAAPTAGLHLTPPLLAALGKAGVRRTEVVLHVGPGTFRPITAATVEQHRMHSERFSISPETVAVLCEVQAARLERRDEAPCVIAVGTTSTRALESLPADLLPLAASGKPLEGSTNLLIAPPYRFKHVNALMTNFHLPRSTLLALVAAMVGLDRLKSIYAEAVRQGYRFYSYGDAMLILP